jgi:hypothetical protein
LAGRDAQDDNPYAAPRAPIGPPSGPPDGSGDARATLVGRGWLRRTLLVETPEGPFVVEYAGLGERERVYVNGRLAASGGGWFHSGKRFDFSVGSTQASIEVNINIFIGTLRGLRFGLNGTVIYSEGWIAR